MPISTLRPRFAKPSNRRSTPRTWSWSSGPATGEKAAATVVDEAERAIGRGVLLPIRLDGSPPLGFGTFNALDFSGWGGDDNSDAWRRLVSEITRIAAAPVLPPARVAVRILAAGACRGPAARAWFLALRCGDSIRWAIQV